MWEVSTVCDLSPLANVCGSMMNEGWLMEPHMWCSWLIEWHVCGVLGFRILPHNHSLLGTILQLKVVKLIPKTPLTMTSARPLRASIFPLQGRDGVVNSNELGASRPYTLLRAWQMTAMMSLHSITQRCGSLEYHSEVMWVQYEFESPGAFFWASHYHIVRAHGMKVECWVTLCFYLSISGK